LLDFRGATEGGEAVGIVRRTREHRESTGECDACGGRSAESCTEWVVDFEACLDVRNPRAAKSGANEAIVGGIDRLGAHGNVAASGDGGRGVSCDGDVAYGAAFALGVRRDVGPAPAEVEPGWCARDDSARHVLPLLLGG